MSDLVDRASRRETEMIQDLFADQQRRAALSGKKASDSATVCRECGDPIPDDRRAAYPGTDLCVECKRLLERKERTRNVRY
ncbi:TraR/DksA C4-type zinc finger protein [Accumulibacter sp.]|uniref:TraR/DksA C4-type zinc finger protein n=1 Tax=Accumulibacter sp. TaxID=2053492 RepID=UPI001AD191FB|nr:TraR/DksA C4-type zinc finger protein [Accumulibacter sp.]MBN8452234.1 TraR/DksA C4-type zinc finger protein [Accumulibacter sp.]